MNSQDDDARGGAPHPRPTPVAVQLLATILFAAFAIVAVVMAFNAFWPAGFVLAMILGWQGFMPERRIERDVRVMMRKVAPDSAGAAEPRGSGNASFDRYRADMLDRLEQEQKSFEEFLGRLRAARDAAEFDRFMDDRANRGDSATAPA